MCRADAPAMRARGRDAPSTCPSPGMVVKADADGNHPICRARARRARRERVGAARRASGRPSRRWVFARREERVMAKSRACVVRAERRARSARRAGQRASPSSRRRASSPAWLTRTGCGTRPCSTPVTRRPNGGDDGSGTSAASCNGFGGRRRFAFKSFGEVPLVGAAAGRATITPPARVKILFRARGRRGGVKEKFLWRTRPC